MTPKYRSPVGMGECPNQSHSPTQSPAQGDTGFETHRTCAQEHSTLHELSLLQARNFRRQHLPVPHLSNALPQWSSGERRAEVNVQVSLSGASVPLAHEPHTDSHSHTLTLTHAAGRRTSSWRSSGSTSSDSERVHPNPTTTVPWRSSGSSNDP